MNKREAYKVLQRAWIEENNVKNGDTIKILRSFKEDEMGIDFDYDDNDNDKIGKEFIFDSACCDDVGIDLYDTYSLYPFFVLEKTKSVEVKRSITLNDLTEEQYQDLKQQFKKES